MKKAYSANDYVKSILSGDRAGLAKGITLIESRKQEDRDLAIQVLEKLFIHTGKSIRIGITGVPGAGKSTFIESLGKLLTSSGKKVAVLSIDPSSSKTRGSILGDKTRMEELSQNELAFIRPSPSGNSLGGITDTTREAMLLCEAAGYEIIIVETVGVGQNETKVYGMVDFFLLMLITGAGDELQSMKKGIFEMADGIVINKADGNNANAAKLYGSEISKSLHYFSAQPIPVMSCSALHNKGVEAVWKEIMKVISTGKKNGSFHKRRREQRLNWLNSSLRDMLELWIFNNASMKKSLKDLESKVIKGEIFPLNAARLLIKKIKP
ncbi:MAG: methylmalonyl Co-A mutase-associated GTPase MeaB [Cytophagaceae bacterium]